MWTFYNLNFRGSHHMQDTKFVCVNSWLRLSLGQLVNLQFPAANSLNLGTRMLHGTLVYTVIYFIWSTFSVMHMLFGPMKKLAGTLVINWVNLLF